MQEKLDDPLVMLTAVGCRDEQQEAEGGPEEAPEGKKKEKRVRNQKLKDCLHKRLFIYLAEDLLNGKY